MGLKDFLQGKWLGHPLHAMFVHVPMGLWPAALIFDLGGFTGAGGNLFVQISFYAILLGLLVALAAIPAGWADWSDIKPEKPAWKIGIYHMVLNGTALVIWLANLLVRLPLFQEAERVTGAQLALSVAGTLVLLVGAWFGGRMVFDQGTTVARLSKKKWRKAAKKGNSAVPEE